MALSDLELSEIEKRNKQRKDLKHAASKGPWMYDSWAFVHQSEKIPKDRRFGILVRPMSWFDALGHRIDEGLPKDQEMVNQGYYDAEYVAKARNDDSESDVDVLLLEVRRLRRISK
jgi:hypothetical protein